MKNIREVRKKLKGNEEILKQLEGVYKTSTDIFQKKRVLSEIKNLKTVIDNLKKKLNICREENGLFLEEENRDVENKFSILRNIAIFKYNNAYKDKEMDAAITYADFFERNYLSILSEHYIRLDYSHSLMRDIFYPRFMEIKKLLKDYDYEIEVLNKEEYRNVNLYRDKSVVYNIRQNYLLSTDRYFKDLKHFLGELINDHESGGNIILNPFNMINLSEFEKDGKLDGYPVISAIDEIYQISWNSRYLKC